MPATKVSKSARLPLAALMARFGGPSMLAASDRSRWRQLQERSMSPTSMAIRGLRDSAYRLGVSAGRPALVGERFQDRFRGLFPLWRKRQLGPDFLKNLIRHASPHIRGQF